jgi:lipoic acid synthetase
MKKERRTPSDLIIPHWLKRRIDFGNTYQDMRNALSVYNVSTVCNEARCPNCKECFSRGKAAFLILGKICTRKCAFCAIDSGIPLPPDPEEPEKIAKSVRLLELGYVVITSVTRDDLPDGGAEHFVKTVQAIRKVNPDVIIELLIPDFGGDETPLRLIMEAKPDVINHNLETVPRLYKDVRPEADYKRSLNLLGLASRNSDGIRTKSGIMLGLGENEDEVEALLGDLIETGCRTLTIGQYLQPSFTHIHVMRYISPEEFDSWRDKALGMGFESVASGPFVRSSYNADLLYYGEKV